MLTYALSALAYLILVNAVAFLLFITWHAVASLHLRGLERVRRAQRAYEQAMRRHPAGGKR